MTERPLAGLRILVTRPRDQASKLAHGIQQHGGEPILYPLLEIQPLGNTPALSEALSRLAGFDLAIFISPNAVSYGMAALLAAGGLPPGLRVAAVGQGSAQALRDAGVANVIAPQQRFDSEALLDLPELQHVSGWKVAIFRGEDGRELLGDTLQARGAQVEYLACYRRLKPQGEVNAVLRERPDVFTLSSSEALRYLWEMLDEQGRQRVLQLPLWVPHQRIAEAAAALGWRQVMVAPGGDDGMLSGLIAWAKSRAPE